MLRSSDNVREGKRVRFDSSDDVRGGKRVRVDGPTMDSVHSNPHLRQVRYTNQYKTVILTLTSVSFLFSRSIRQTVAMNRELTLNSTDCWFPMPLAKRIDGVRAS